MKIISLFLIVITTISCAQNSEKALVMPAADTSVKLVLETIQSKDGSKYTLYTDSTWRVSPVVAKEKSRKQKKGNVKSNRQTEQKELSGPLPAAENNSVDKPASSVSFEPEKTIPDPSVNYSSPAPKKSTYYSSPSSESYSSLCGAPTKKGGSCRRVVKGGGRCWQH